MCTLCMRRIFMYVSYMFLKLLTYVCLVKKNFQMHDILLSFPFNCMSVASASAIDARLEFYGHIGQNLYASMRYFVLHNEMKKEVSLQFTSRMVARYMHYLLHDFLSHLCIVVRYVAIYHKY